MIIPPKYQLTKNIVLMLGQLDTNRAIIDSLPLPEKVEENIRRASLLGSSLFSARIEGNRFTEKDEKMEVANLTKVIAYVLKKHAVLRAIEIKDILHWHNLIGYSGHFRTGQEGIFDQAGNLIYHAPPPLSIPKLMENLVNYVDSPRETLIPIRAILSHLILERIHPFEDGNGRIGRLLQMAILARGGFAMKGLVVVEEEIDKNRPLYYHAIEYFFGDATEFIELMLGFLATSSEKAKNKVLAGQKYNRENLLPSRRREILAIIRDHQEVSLDFLSRRFLKIGPRLLRYDLKCLADEGYIMKIGKTRGAMYTIKLPL